MLCIMEMTQSDHQNETEILRAELELRRRQIEAIRLVAQALFGQQSHKLDEMLLKTLCVAIEVTQADAGSLQMHDPATDSLVF
ncbi:MAG TPA: hypothetical protein VF719_13345, partial [Abditibacteriaceae bacterium]